MKYRQIILKVSVGMTNEICSVFLKIAQTANCILMNLWHNSHIKPSIFSLTILVVFAHACRTIERYFSLASEGIYREWTQYTDLESDRNMKRVD